MCVCVSLSVMQGNDALGGKYVSRGFFIRGLLPLTALQVWKTSKVTAVVYLGNAALGEMLSSTEKGLKLSQTSFGSEPSTPGEDSLCLIPKMLGPMLHCPALK